MSRKIIQIAAPKCPNCGAENYYYSACKQCEGKPMSVTKEFEEASARAAIRALRGLEITAIMLETHGPELFPANDQGQVPFARALMDSAAAAIRDSWRTAIREVERFPENTGGMVEQFGNLRHALGKIADLEDSEAGEPLDDAIAIAKAALSPQPLT